MLKDRVLTAIWGTILFLFFLLCPWGKGIPFFLLLALLSLLGLKELFSALVKSNFVPFQFFGFISSLSILLLTYLRNWNLLPHLIFVSFVVFFLEGLCLRKGQKLLRDISVTLFGVIYTGGLFSYLLLINLSEATVHPPISSLRAGSWLCVLVVVINWLSDISSYFVGNYFGKKRIFPRLSPNKTLEGLVGGILITLLGGTALGIWARMGLINSLILALTIAISAPLGDLAESALKRELGIKDFSSILPGHGGILDRFDSLLFSAFFSFYVLKLLSIIP
ncbi:phosphatidate cytidylyltransferase [bacterium]|nr:phosphatidate cytidylyltransferase [bacterium]